MRASSRVSGRATKLEDGIQPNSQRGFIKNVQWSKSGRVMFIKVLSLLMSFQQLIMQKFSKVVEGDFKIVVCRLEMFLGSIPSLAYI